MKESRAHIAKKVVIILIIALLLFPIIHCFVHYSMYQTDQEADPITDLSNYRKWSTSGWVYDKPFTIFPESSILVQAKTTDYLFKRVRSPFPLLFDGDAVLYLACGLNEDDFYSECERLQQLCGNRKSGYGNNPAYVYAVRGGGFYYQYALIDDETYTIHYIEFQNRAFAEKYIDISLLPIK